uniref:Acyl-coenzyme A diphosphatase NUDT19 n=1 Tax=Gasterosteus aculeatus TaxID=69293 RepID=G3PVB0_GASAC
MNTTLKHWREAATLILAAAAAASPLTGGQGRSHLPHKSCFDYDVLLLKRSSKSGFMPNACVFPGGLVHASDFSSEWLDVFKTFSKSPNFGLRSVTQPGDTRPPLFATDRLKLGSPIPGEVAFRICALRETFEECGVLLFVSKQEEKANELCSRDLNKWRDLVNQNPSNFIQMCRELEVLPNIWALHEWGNWLTPEGRYGVKRFDTAFFICCLQEIPPALQDDKEIVSVKWSTPSEVLQNYQAQEFWIAPPQVYEISRMCRLPLLNDLHNFSSRRATEGCEQLLPVLSSKDEHFTALLPGDRWYPSATSGEAASGTSSDPKLEDPQEEESSLHRIVTVDPYTITLQINITPKYNHLLPVLGQTFPYDSKSKL